MVTAAWIFQRKVLLGRQVLPCFHKMLSVRVIVLHTIEAKSVSLTWLVELNLCTRRHLAFRWIEMILRMTKCFTSAEKLSRAWRRLSVWWYLCHVGHYRTRDESSHCQLSDVCRNNIYCSMSRVLDLLAFVKVWPGLVFHLVGESLLEN